MRSYARNASHLYKPCSSEHKVHFLLISVAEVDLRFKDAFDWSGEVDEVGDQMFRLLSVCSNGFE